MNKENLKIELTKKHYSCYLHVKLLLEGEVISEVSEDITIQD